MVVHSSVTPSTGLEGGRAVCKHSMLLQGGQGEQVLATQRTPVYDVRGGAPDGRLPRPWDRGGVDGAVQQPARRLAHHA